nr:MAG TPA_asm: hypothetical protein [Caudoviricetes sp.]
MKAGSRRPPPPFLCFYFKRSETNGANIFPSRVRARSVAVFI